MTERREPHKLSCFVDETGQDTKGELFIVGAVVTPSDYGDLEAALERIEEQTGKGKVKWRGAKDVARIAYISRVLTLDTLNAKLAYCVFHETQDYADCTVETVAAAAALYSKDARLTVFVDGLPQSQVRRFGSELRRRGISVRKVRGVRKEESSSLMRLADAVCGFVRAALTDRNDLVLVLTEAKARAVVVELRPDQ
jgi:Protein of unknown function (DUF3800)